MNIRRRGALRRFVLVAVLNAHCANRSKFAQHHAVDARQQRRVTLDTLEAPDAKLGALVHGVSARRRRRLIDLALLLAHIYKSLKLIAYALF